jgi:hypothetical protein
LIDCKPSHSQAASLRIADSLQTKLTSREEQALAVKPTNNPEAYDAYLRGLAFEARSAYTFGYLAFDTKDVSQFPIIGVGPQMGIIGCFD